MSRSVFCSVISRSRNLLTCNIPISSTWSNCNTGKFISSSSTTSDRKKITRNEELGQTTVMLQDRLDIQELPAIVRKVNNINSLSKNNSVTSEDNLRDRPDEEIDTFQVKRVKFLSEAEQKEMIEGFNRCNTTKSAFLLLETIPDEEVTPTIAYHALKKIIELENNQHYRNRMVRSGEELPENFARTAIFSQLIDTIIAGCESNIVLETLKLVSRDMIGGATSLYRDRLCNEILIRVTEGKFSAVQLCEMVKLFSLVKSDKKSTEDIDKLWVGFVDRGKEIDEHNIVTFFRILPLLKNSQKVLYNMLEKRVFDVWWRLPSRTVVEILSILVEAKLPSTRIANILSRWLSTNVHSVSEDDLLGIVTGFFALDYVDDGIEKTLERFVKSKGIKIKDASLMAAIMEYCAKFRLRSTYILEGCGEYFIKYGSTLSPVTVKSLFVPFGLMDFHPSNGVRFWQVIETALEEKFIQFRPDDAIDIMLACVYLEKHPINFVKKIFNPYFLDRLHSYKDGTALELMRAKLKIFDTAMTLECPQYQGPLLPREYSTRSIWQDGRIKRMINSLYDTVTVIAGSSDRVSISVVMSQLPVTELYVVDILLHPRGMGPSMLNFNLKKDRNLYIALLIHVPEHYCSQGTHLLGPQVMKKRHLRRLGLRVADLEYTKLAKLKVHPKSLEEYVLERLEAAEKAL
ncbi:FAST kinase domain-containing protein 3, mitochondrial [Anabrus simplex]|uniref:FAST kinase domain-containing protein 3, mitochondrial n=1 Tax=Anabrus simplex TaxID=316456 RepID=UPI0035A2B7DA